MTTMFTGFGEGALDFYEGLAADNSRAYWQAHADTYRRTIAEPLAALAAALEPEFGAIKVFRPYRDVRFSKDSGPTRSMRAWRRWPERPILLSEASTWAFPQPGLSTAGLFVAGGCHRPARDQLERFRLLQDDAAAAADLDATLADLAARGYPLDEGEPLKSAPRGWPKDHPRITLLRRTSLTVSRLHEPGLWLFDARCLDVVVDGWRVARAWNTWLDANVGPSALE